MSPPRKQQKSSESVLPVSEDGIQEKSLEQSVDQEIKEGLSTLKLRKSHEYIQLSLFSTQESQPICKEMILIDKLNSLNQSIQTEKLFQKLEADSILGGRNSEAYWNELTETISTSLSLPTLTDSSDSDLNWLGGYAKVMDANSWFSMKSYLVPRKSLFKICCPSSTVSLVGYCACENIQENLTTLLKINLP